MKSGKVFIIAEAGVNHNGEIKKAYELVDIAAWANADAVKFQTFKLGECTGRFAIKIDYLKAASSAGETRYDITKKLALPYEAFLKIQRYAKKKGVLFLTTPDGYESLEFVNNVLKIPIIKISSTEVTHLKFLEEVARKRKPIIFSTGMSTLYEVRKALNVMRKYNNDITALHCTSAYPAPLREVNLRAMLTMQKACAVKVGYSDHTSGFEAAIAAVSLGASVIEKHFTIDKRLPGPDHKASLSPSELKMFITMIRNTELILGDGIKKPTAAEIKNINGIRRSIVASKALKKGMQLKAGDITYKRPGFGIHPYDCKKIIGLVLRKDLVEDEPIRWEYLKRG